MKLNTKSLKDVRLGTPLLREALYFAQIVNVKREPNRNGDGDNLNFGLKLLDETVYGYEDDAEIRNPAQNLTVFHTISLKETEKNAEILARKIKELGIAIGKPEDFEDLELEELDRVVVKFKLKHTPAKDGYAAKNEIDRLYPVKEGDTFIPPAM